MENRHSGVEHPLCPRNTAVTKTILAPQSLIAKLCGVFFLKVLWLVHQCVGTCQPWVAVVTGYNHQGTGGLGKGLSPQTLVLPEWYDVCVSTKSLQSCPTPFDPVDCSPPGSSVHAILQARMLEWVAIPFSRGSSPPRG